MKSNNRYAVCVTRECEGKEASGRGQEVKGASRFPLPASRSAFTLMELLVVVAIILILAGLLLGALRGARSSAKAGAAKVEISQIQTAIKAYYNEYAAWPTNPPTSGLINGVVWAGILSGTDTTNNPRKIVFMEFKSGAVNSLGILDPWGTATGINSTNIYFFGFDTDYNNTIDVYSNTNNPPSGTATGGPPGAHTNTTFVIWSAGDPKSPKTIGSWQ